MNYGKLKTVVILAALSTVSQTSAHESGSTGLTHVLEHNVGTTVTLTALFLIVLLLVVAKRIKLF